MDATSIAQIEQSRESKSLERRNDLRRLELCGGMMMSEPEISALQKVAALPSTFKQLELHLRAMFSLRNHKSEIEFS